MELAPIANRENIGKLGVAKLFVPQFQPPLRTIPPESPHFASCPLVVVEKLVRLEKCRAGVAQLAER